MDRVTALAHAVQSQSPLAILRSLIVCGCALALILAGKALPLP
ncbi:hypothetical protein U8326_15140 [Tsuneonella sp. CC-YZS046]|nr:hypothetical protein [Tsuneonella sp. CC-YZS046]WRO66351.1 hypothetical protein U8326_15140 [Tsuneonella sp. CC-YZS046]